jgi:hypothetical protein
LTSVLGEQRWLAGYTINIYNTTSRHLINGNDANHFIAKDILSIHKIVLKGLHEQGVKGLSIEELNRHLGNQLQNLLDNKMVSIITID